MEKTETDAEWLLLLLCCSRGSGPLHVKALCLVARLKRSVSTRKCINTMLFYWLHI